LRGRFAALLLVGVLLMVCLPRTAAISTGHFAWPGAQWYVFLSVPVTDITTGVVYREDVRALHQLAEHGFRIGVGANIWDRFPEYTILDFYYNSSRLRELERAIDQVFKTDPGQGPGVNPERVWSLTLGGEEPFWHPGFPSDNPMYAPFNETYHSETGFWFKPYDKMNWTEWRVAVDWATEKHVWVFNHLYDYVKTKWPHLVVFQSFFPPVYDGLGAAPFELKADAFSIDGYLAGNRDNPWMLYWTQRWYTTFAPDKEFHMVLWGQEPWPWEGELGGAEHIRRNAWVSYLGGPDAIWWFTWNPTYGDGWERNDTLGKKLFLYINRIAAELNKLPAFKSRPRILLIGNENEFIGPETGWPTELGVFTEFDIMDCRFFAKDNVNLSQYDLVIYGSTPKTEAFVRKMNSFVQSGGNVLFIGGTGMAENWYRNGTRQVLLSIEKNATEIWLGGYVRANVTLPNPLGIELEKDLYSFGGRMLKIDNSTGDYHAVGEFYQVEEDNSTTVLEGYPLILYHNSTAPDSGWVLYWGGLVFSEDEGFSWEDRRDMVFVRNIIKTIIRGFGFNFLGLNDGISTEETEFMLITQAQVEQGTVMAGISNFQINSWENYTAIDKDINYSLDLERFGLTDGDYWVHSLDSNETLGQFSSSDGILHVPIHVPANATRLLLISKDRPAPGYCVDIFPPVPTDEDIAAWPPPHPEVSLELRSFQDRSSNSLHSGTSVGILALVSGPSTFVVLMAGMRHRRRRV